MTKRSASRILRSLHGRAISILNRGANTLVSPLEIVAVRRENGPALSVHRPLFIVGAPRSGSTLLYQLLTAAFDVGYLTNRHCKWYRAPVFVERWRATPFGTIETDFESEHGMTTGSHAPSECGAYWYRFLPRRPHTLSTADVGRAEVAAMRRAIAALTDSVAKPLVFKNLILSLRIPVLADVLPEALFLVIHRDTADTALSILRARQKIFGRIDRWFSLRPTGQEPNEAPEDPHRQAVEQVFGTYAEIDRARRVVGTKRFIDVNYEQVCDSPETQLRFLSQTLAERGLILKKTPRFVCPERFARGKEQLAPPDDWRRGVQRAILNWQTN